ncbi:MAG: branched-chain amino acid ABC transporter permease [Thermodesulfobacteriota bacterium]|jgi:branched-chain amino acid transport system permease protein
MPGQENRSIFTSERIGLLIALAILSAVPLFIKDRAIVELIILANIYAVYVASWDILCGYTGQVNFGHALFVGGGAYAAALLNFYFKTPPWVTIFIGGGIAAIFGLIIGTPCLRLRGPYFALATFAAAAVPYGLTDVYWEITGGLDGLYGISPIWPTLAGRYYFSLLLTALCCGLIYAGGRSNKGLILKSIREDEIGAMASGINTTRYKLVTFIVSGFFAGVAGAFYSHNQLHVGPETLSINLSILVIIMSVVGGIGTITGPICGAYLLTIFNEMLREWEELRLLIYTATVVLMLIFVPKGIVPALSEGISQLFKKRKGG